MMNDLYICKRIAKIEGVETYISRFGTLMSVCKPCNPSNRYNPLTDDALCFRLMIKYRINFNHAMLTDGTLHRYQAVNTITSKGFGLCKNPNKAICLAIIEANKGK